MSVSANRPYTHHRTGTGPGLHGELLPQLQRYVGPSEIATCVVTNTYKYGTLTVIKKVSGGALTPGEFTIDVDVSGGGNAVPSTFNGSTAGQVVQGRHREGLHRFGTCHRRVHGGLLSRMQWHIHGGGHCHLHSDERVWERRTAGRRLLRTRRAPLRDEYRLRAGRVPTRPRPGHRGARIFPSDWTPRLHGRGWLESRAPGGQPGDKPILLALDEWGIEQPDRSQSTVTWTACHILRRSTLCHRTQRKSATGA